MTTSFLDVVWLTICGILVFIMQTGFLCLEAGSTRSKNRINVIIKNLSDLGLSVLIFWAVGYGLMFGNSLHGSTGIDRFLPNLGENKDIWTGSFFLFQSMFCSTAVTILSGATAERIQFRGYLAIAALISGLIYPVFGHWVWQGIDRGIHHGWLAQTGFVDFAGSTVVHSLGGWCALAVLLVMGPRIGRFSAKREYDALASADMPMAFLGTMLLWFGWFGFNGGSNLVFNAHVSNIIANTLIAGSAGLITPIMIMAIRRRPIEVIPILNGSLAGLVSITAGCHAFSSVSALVIGAIGSIAMMVATTLLAKYKIDDVVGAIPVHLAGGLWGTAAVGLFGNLERLGTGLDRFSQIKAQTSGMLACALWAFGLSLIAALIFRRLNILRVSAKQEYIGLNITEHGARSTADDVYSVMRYHAKTGDLKRRVIGDPFTEVGRVGLWYNQVIMALEMAIATNDAIVDTAIDGILTVGCNNLQIKTANPAAGRLFGQPPAALVGQPLQRLFVNTATFSEAGMREIIQAETPPSFIGQHYTGQVFPVEMTATETTAGNKHFFTVFIKDISARQLAEDALIDSRAQERAKAIALEQAMAQLKKTQAQLIHRERLAGQGQLVAGIAHEVNNPVNFIHGNLDHAEQYVQELLEAVETYQRYGSQLPVAVRSQLEEQLEDIDIDYIATDHAKLFSSMKNGTERIRTIVKQLRNFARYDESEYKAIDLHIGIDSTLMVLSHRLEATSRRPRIEVLKQYDQLPTIECYGNAINRAILNILTNAIDAFDRLANTTVTHGAKNAVVSPKITLKTQARPDGICLTISNNGPYIPEADQKRIFDPFFTTQPIGQGPGLGCTISYQIVVEQHHGNLTCHSTQGKGTAFVVELPLKTKEPECAAAEAHQPAKQPVQHLVSSQA